jgi:hypothetical protein
MKYIFTTEQRASGGKIRAQALQEKAAIEIENETWKLAVVGSIPTRGSTIFPSAVAGWC